MIITIAGREREMTGRERIKAREEMILQERRKLREHERNWPASDLEEQPVLDVPVDSKELTLEEPSNTQLGNIYSGYEERTYPLREAYDPSHIIDMLVILRTTRLGGLRRPSEMNEYAKVIQEIRVQPGSTNAHGKVFVKAYVLHLHSLQRVISSPLPNVLEPNAMIDQEFEPIERGKFAFSLPINIRKHSHIVN
ncbi:Bud site selection protein bud4 [Ceratobasidium sp. 423]|nr:Bud site selection protein bud4 [Ceratobasidium sp. 423]